MVQFVERRLRFLSVFRVQSVGEPAVDLEKHPMRFAGLGARCVLRGAYCVACDLPPAQSDEGRFTLPSFVRTVQLFAQTPPQQEQFASRSFPLLP